MTAILVAALFLAAGPEDLQGRVMSVLDGDTITVLDAANVQRTIRLAGVDAPELRQPFGAKAKETLSARVLGKQARVAPRGIRDGRALGVVWLNDRNVNLELVAAGWAWHDKASDASDELAAAEKSAREQRLGLWGDPGLTPPWDWRRAAAARTSQPRRAAAAAPSANLRSMSGKTPSARP